MLAFCWVITMLGSVVGVYFLFLGMSDANGAPQQAAAAAIACACAVVPYVFSRAWQELQRGEPKVELTPEEQAKRDQHSF